VSELRLVLLGSEHDLSGFDCGNAELDRWLIDHAFASQKADLARTYLALDGRTVGGYVSLTTGSIRREAAPKRCARGMPRHPIPIILIARLAVDCRHQGNRLGSRLLAEALRLAVTASDTVAARLVVVDAIDEQAAGFYRRWGFIRGSGKPAPVVSQDQRDPPLARGSVTTTPEQLLPAAKIVTSTSSISIATSTAPATSRSTAATATNWLVAAVADRAEIPRAEAKRVLGVLEEILLEALSNAQKVRVGGVVQLTVRVKPAQKKRIGRNPATGEEITIAAKPASVDVRARPLAKAKAALPSVQKARRRLAA
jgi:nucleoid DNA-binding protein